MPLRLWVDEKWRRKYVHIPLLFPFWGNVVSEKTPFSKDVFETYACDTSHYSLARSIEESDIVLLPYRYNTLRERDQALIDEAARAASERTGEKVERAFKKAVQK